MLNRFQNYIQKNNLCLKTDKILLGISGGIDSIIMFHLFRLSGYHFAVAHCNFQLRGQESDEDEDFVKNLAENFNIPFYTVRFNTELNASEEGISIQMAARDLRYEWFEEIRKSKGFEYIAIAHNSDDQIETFFINLARGTGIKGLTGIKNKSGKIIRPLLFASRKEIQELATQNKFLFREDSSNSSKKYARNLIRHDVISSLEKINPNFRQVMIENIQHLKETEQIFNLAILEKYKSVVSKINETILLNINELKKLDPIESYLHEFLNPYGFSQSQIIDIVSAFDGSAGKQFISSTHRLIKDRENLILEEIVVKSSKVFYIEENDKHSGFPISLQIEKVNISNDFKIEKSPFIGQFDLEKITFPLTIRKWQKGDYFMPLGMKNLKKVSDFFIDQKLSLSEKENTWILESGNKIVWIIGLRPDERFKVRNDTKTILKIQLI